MSRVVQLFVILCFLVKLTLALLSCTADNSISMCTDSRRQGDHVYVNFSLAPLQENKVSCSCFIFAQSDTDIYTAYETSSDSDVILVNTSIRLGDQTLQEATASFIQLSANSFKKLHFNGDIDKTSPGVCLKFSSSSMINIEVVCLLNKDTTVPISGFSTTTNITTKTTFEATTQPISKTEKQPTSDTTPESTSSITELSTPSSTEQSSSSTAEVSQHENIVIEGAAGGGFLVVAIVVVVVVIMCRRRRLSVSQNKEQNINMSVNQTEENPYNVENELYVSADDDILASGNRTYDVTHLQGFDVNHDEAKTTHDVTNLSGSDNTYDQPDQYNPKQNVENMNRCSNEYSVVFKNKNNTPSVDDTDTHDHVDRV